MAAKLYMVFVTYMLVMYSNLARHYQKISSCPIFSLFTHATHATTHLTTHTSQPPPTNPPYLPPPPPPLLPLQKMMSASKALNNNIIGDEDARAPNFMNAARDVQNWALNCIKMAGTEKQCYCKFFEVVKV